MLFPYELSWQDIVDILLNSYILFRLYVLFRGTNAFRVFVGITVLWFMQRVAVAVGLILTSWVIQGVTAAAALIIIVVFRYEIRTVLQTRNLRTLLWGLPKPALASPVKSIAEAVYGLAEKRIGALIVVPGQNDLSSKLHSGIRVDCRLSAEMLMSVFWPDNPVHDGAAVVRGDHIQEVAAILPLSARSDIPTYYGTRHRAAAGIAELSDALAVVVSEERGAVTVAQSDRIKTMPSRTALESYLEQHVPAAAVRVSGRRETLELFAAGIVCLLFITSVWFGFARRESTLVSMEVPLEYVNRDSRFYYVDADVDTVRLQLSGAAALLKTVQPGQLKARIDLRNGVTGENLFEIGAANLSLPPGVLLRKATPGSVAVTLDVKTTKNLPIQVDWAGRLPGGLRIQKVVLVPDRAQVTCGSLQIGALATVYTEKVDVGALPPDGGMTVRLAVPAPAALVAPEAVTIRYVVPGDDE